MTHFASIEHPTPTPANLTAKAARKQIERLKVKLWETQKKLRAAQATLDNEQRKAARREVAVKAIFNDGGKRPSEKYGSLMRITREQEQELWVEMLALPECCHYDFHRTFIVGKLTDWRPLA